MWGEPKTTHESAAGAEGDEAGVDLCKRVALVSPLPERRGHSWGIQELGNDCKVLAGLGWEWGHALWDTRSEATDLPLGAIGDGVLNSNRRGGGGGKGRGGKGEQGETST